MFLKKQAICTFIIIFIENDFILEENTFFSIKNWNEDDRPREKMLQKGRIALSDAELIAILIGSGSRNESAVSLSQRILVSAGNNLNELGKLTISDLMKFKGMGEAKAITIAAAMELGRRRRGEEALQKKKDNFKQFGF